MTFSDYSLTILTTYLHQVPNLLDGDPNPSSIVPRWFKAKNQIPLFPEKKPVYDGPDTAEILARIDNWIKDPCFDLPDTDFFTDVQNESLTAYQAKFEEWNEKKEQWNISQNLIQLRKWINWLTMYAWIDLTDNEVMKRAGLINDRAR